MQRCGRAEVGVYRLGALVAHVACQSGGERDTELKREGNEPFCPQL